MPRDEYWGPTARDLGEESKEACLVGEWPCQPVEQEQELVLLSEGVPGSLSMGHLCIPVQDTLLPWRKPGFSTKGQDVPAEGCKVNQRGLAASCCLEEGLLGGRELG